MGELTADILEDLYYRENMTQKEIGEKFGVTQSWVSVKMKEWGIESRFNGWWSDEEEQILAENYKQIPKEDLQELLPGRTWKMIKQKARALGLSDSAEKHRHSEEVLECLRKNSEENTIEVDFGKLDTLSYVVGVIDGDGYHDQKGSLGLETKSAKFADKFSKALAGIGLNPGRGQRRGKQTVWAASQKLVQWCMKFTWQTKFRWLKEEGDAWKYMEGAYDSDGDFSNTGPRICSYDNKEKKFIRRVLTEILGLEASIHQNNVYIPVASREKFFENVDPVYEKRRP